MRVTILALGSRGDVLPYATLGRALQVAGHQVRLATFEGFQSLVTGQGLAFWPVRGDAQAILMGSSGQALAESGRSMVRMAVAVMRSFGALARDYARDLAGLAGQPTDVIVNQLPGGLYGRDLAERLGVPMVAAAVMPLVPTSSRPMLAFPDRPSVLPGYNRATHWLAYQIVWQAFRPTINRWRRETLGLAPARFWGDYRDLGKAVPVLNGFSRHVVPRPPDWGDQVHVTGYWFAEETDWQVPQDLARFLEAGPPPVYVGFGSMPVRDAARLTGLVVEALDRAGQRGILGTGWAGIGQGSLPDTVLGVAYAPYRWLFPRMAAVVHHGGSGTTALGLRAGVPSLVVPFLFDQFFWGQRIASLGVGPAPIPHPKLTVEGLAERIDRMVAGQEMGRRARHLGAKIQGEDGLLRAVAVLERVVGNAPS